MNKTYAILYLLIGLLISSCTKDEAILTATISGYVTEYTNANTPIAGASVTIDTKGITKTTGSDGRYEITAIEPGTYTVQVSANGYQTTTKQITVYAGETRTLDFQLSPAGQSVEIAPQMLSFGPSTNKLTFSIKNKENSSLQYSITNYPSYISVSPAAGSVSAKGVQTITVEVNRDAITSDQTCQLLINIGNDSHPVNISINSQEVAQKVVVSPAVLDFGSNYNELQFTIKNIGTAGDLTWNISDPMEPSIKVSPSNGTTAMGNSTQVSVKLDRSQLAADLQTFLNVNVPGGSVSVQVAAQKKAGESGDGNTPSGDITVKANLLAYYTFDDETMNDSYDYEMHGQLYNSPSFTDNTPNGNGKALFLNAVKEQYAVIPYKPFYGRSAYSISFWIKDFGNGDIFGSENSKGLLIGPGLKALETGNFRFQCGVYLNYYVDFNYKHRTLQDGKWHMICITKNSSNNADLYVDGIKVDTGYQTYASADGLNIKFGGISSMYLDNIRFYGTDLTSEEIKEIYNSEK